MILLFLGSWRSTLVVMISIPLAILSSIVGLFFLGETLNTMTLGGLALAIGILVDDSTVTIENTHRLLTEGGMPLPEATLHGSAEIAVPTLVSTLAIACVFTSVVFLEGPARYLFTPLGLAVVFAMLASYGLSRTLTPITIGLLLKGEQHESRQNPHPLAGSVASTPRSSVGSRACAPATLRCSPCSWRDAASCRSPPYWFSLSAPACSCSSAATSIPTSTAAASSSTFAPRLEPASRRLRKSSRRSTTRSAKSFPSAIAS